MKTFIIILSSFLLCTSSFAQNKILFDNTKSEQAGNADWVIDNGSSRFPVPTQSGITGNPFPNPSGDIDTYWSGGLSMFGIEMVKQGFTVETLPPSGNITYGDVGNLQDLSNYEVFVICEPNNPFSDNEKTAIMNFVQNGGGLFMIADHAGADRDGDGWDALEVWNDFIQNNSIENNAFGFIFDEGSDIGHSEDGDYFTESIANLPDDPLLHGIAGDVNGMETHGGATMTINVSDNSTVKAVVYYKHSPNSGNTNVLCAYASYGSGKIVGLNDSSVAEDETSNSGTTYPGWIQPIETEGTPVGIDMDNGRLCTNAVVWLATPSASGSEEKYTNAPLIYPNPTTGLICLENIPAAREIKIFNAFGQVVMTKRAVFEIETIDISQLSSGMYFLMIYNQNGTVSSDMILKE